MEGTKPKEVLRTSLAQPDVFAHDADDVSLLFDRVCKIAGISHLTIVCSKGKREWHRIQVAAVDSLWNFPESGAWCWITRPCAVIPHHTGFRFEIVPSKTIRRENPDTLQRIEGEKIEVASTMLDCAAAHCRLQRLVIFRIAASCICTSTCTHAPLFLRLPESIGTIFSCRSIAGSKFC